MYWNHNSSTISLKRMSTRKKEGIYRQLVNNYFLFLVQYVCIFLKGHVNKISQVLILHIMFISENSLFWSIEQK